MVTKWNVSQNHKQRIINQASLCNDNMKSISKHWTAHPDRETPSLTVLIIYCFAQWKTYNWNWLKQSQLFSPFITFTILQALFDLHFILMCKSKYQCKLFLDCLKPNFLNIKFKCQQDWRYWGSNTWISMCKFQIDATELQKHIFLSSLMFINSPKWCFLSIQC